MRGSMMNPRVTDDRLFDLEKGAVITVPECAVVQNSTSGDPAMAETPKVLRLGRARGRYYLKVLGDIPEDVKSTTEVKGLSVFTVADVCPGMKLEFTWVDTMGGKTPRHACTKKHEAAPAQSDQQPPVDPPQGPGYTEPGNGLTQADTAMESGGVAVPGVEPVTGDERLRGDGLGVSDQPMPPSP